MNSKKNEDSYSKINSEGKRIPRYRYIMEQHLGRPLTPEECIHHINGDHFDDRIENLVIMTNSEHAKLHGKDKFQNKGNFKVSVNRDVFEKFREYCKDNCLFYSGVLENLIKNYLEDMKKLQKKII